MNPNLVGIPALVCYVCELAYTPRDRRRKCTGDPVGPPVAKGRM
jgi:hypothetical protein